MSRFIISLFIIIIAQPAIALSIDMEKGSLKDLSSWVSLQTGKNILLGPGVDADLSIYCPEVEPGEEYKVFKSAIMSAGFNLVESGNYATVINGENLKNEIQKQTQSLQNKVIQFKNIAVEQVTQSLESAAKIYADDSLISVLPGLNSVVVFGDLETITYVSSLAKVLDRKRQQVLIEAVIFETREGDSENLGTDIFGSVSLGKWSAAFNSNLTGSDQVNALPLGGALSIDHDADLSVLIQALESSDDTRLLSTPSVVVSSSELARISVGQNVPFVTGSVNIDGTAQPIQTIERHDIGVTPQVVPFVLENGVVDLQITQISSSVSASSLIATDIITNQRSINTRLLVQDKQYILLGGLIGEEDRTETRSVPVLGSIPLLGFLFRSTTTETVRSRLNVLLRVTLV